MKVIEERVPYKHLSSKTISDTLNNYDTSEITKQFENGVQERRNFIDDIEYELQNMLFDDYRSELWFGEDFQVKYLTEKYNYIQDKLKRIGYDLCYSRLKQSINYYDGELPIEALEKFKNFIDTASLINKYYIYPTIHDSNELYVYFRNNVNNELVIFTHDKIKVLLANDCQYLKDESLLIRKYLEFDNSDENDETYEFEKYIIKQLSLRYEDG